MDMVVMILKKMVRMMKLNRIEGCEGKGENTKKKRDGENEREEFTQQQQRIHFY